MASVQTRPAMREVERAGSDSPFAILGEAVREARAHQIGDVAAALAYYTFTALPATLLTSLGVFALIAGPDTVETLAQKLRQVAPAETVSLLQQGLNRALENRSGAVVMIVVGAVLAVWTATGAITALMRGLNSVYGCRETRGFVSQRLTALALLALSAFALLLTLALLVLGPHLSSWIGGAVGMRTLVEAIWWAAQWPLLLGVLFFTVSSILSLGPCAEREGRGLLSFGAVVAVAAWLATSAAFAVYVSRFGSYDKTWGSLSAVIVTLVWLWLGGLALLLGAEVDAATARRRR